MSYSPIPKWTITDANGEPIVGGTVEFFEAGTSTPKDVYSDAARSISAGDTLTTDALGQIGPVYLDTEEATKAVCKDADGVTLWTVDSITPPGGATGAAATSGISRAISPLDYGAVGDGTSDESSEVQQAITAGSGAGFIDLAGKTYRCDSALTVPTGTRIVNGTLDFSQMSSGAACISATGSLGSAVFATADIDGGDNSVTLSSTASFSSNRWIKLSSNSAWGAVGSSNKDGELARIDSVSSGITLKIEGRAIDGYTVANSAKAEQITTVADIAFEDVNIVGTFSTSASVLEFVYCEKVSLRNVHISGYSFAGIRLTSCVDCTVDGCTVTNTLSGSAVIVDGTSQRISLSSVHISDAQIGVEIGRANDGVCRFVTLSQCNVSAGGFTGSTCIKFDQDTQLCSVDNSSLRGGNITSGSVYGVVDYGSANRVTDCDIASVADAGILSESRVSKSPSFNAKDITPCFRYSGNTISSLDYGIVIVPYSGVAVDGGDISKNRIHHASVNAFELNSVAAISNIVIDGNIIVDARVCLSLSGVSAFDNIKFTNNIAKLADQLADIDIDATSKRLFIQGNDIYQDGLNSFAVDVDVATSVNLTELHIDGNSFACAEPIVEQIVRLASADAGRLSEFTINDNVIDAPVKASGEPVFEVTDVRKGQICRNIMSGAACESAIVIQSSSATVSSTVGHILVKDNQIELGGFGAVGVRCVYVDASGSSIEDISVIDNMIDCGGINVEEAIGINVATGYTMKRLIIKGNNIYSTQAGCKGIELVSADADGISEVSVSGNNVDTETTAFSMTKCKNASVTGNTFATRDTGTAYTFTLDDCETVNVASNAMTLAATGTPAAVVSVGGAAVTGVLFSGNLVSGGFYSFYENATATTQLAAIGNMLSGGSSSYLGSDGGGWDLGAASNTAADFKNGY